MKEIDYLCDVKERSFLSVTDTQPPHTFINISKKRMRKGILFILTLLPLMAWAQHFDGYYYNEEYQVYLKINAERSDITVPGQEIYGQLTGYFGSKRDGRLWLITEMEQVNDKKLIITVVNDYGSEDFTASLTEDDNHVITMKHQEGSTYKIVVNSKYVKIPKQIKLVKTDKP